MPGIVNLLKERGTKTVLDLGNGTGRHTVYMAQNGFTVYGMDNSPQAIQSAQEWLQAEGLTADLKYGDITEPFPYPDAFFDGLISVQVINHGDNATVKRIADEITRVIKPGGLIFITVATLKNQAKTWEQIEPNTFMPLDGREKGLLHHFFTPEELQALFSGFEIKDTHLDKGQHYCLTAVKK
jgi:2-polyprenyl-3-methyl-5-hydroxy-6-metoxy-1,4-benzoquinol methylase